MTYQYRNPDHLSVPLLRERGWTEATISKFLGDPDAYKPNPYYRSAAPMRLYARQRVEDAETQEAWADERKSSERRMAVAAKAVATKKAKLLAQLDKLEITMPCLPMDMLIRHACVHYNERKSALRYERLMSLKDTRDSDYYTATPESDPAFLERITVNYLRHCLTSYEEELRNIVGKVGVREGYAEINRRVYAAIAESYPLLAEECCRQLAIKIKV